MTFNFYTAQTAADFDNAKAIFLEYAEWLKVDLCFQQFEEELANIATLYNAPQGGIILMETGGEIVGCVGVKKFKSDTENNVCELKRMYIRKNRRRHGFGRILLEKAVVLATELGYTKMRLDTLKRLKPAIGLYLSNRFVEIPPYYDNPLGAVLYFEKKLTPSV